MRDLSSSRRLGVRYVVYLFLVLIDVMAVLGWGVISYHWIFENSYMLPANAPIGLTTERQGKIYWVLLVLTVVRILELVACTARSANTFNPAFKHVLSLVAFLAVLGEIAGLVVFVIERNSCNNPPNGDPSGRFNMCNDYRWCCVYATQNMTDICLTMNTSVVEPSCGLLLQACEPQIYEQDLSPNWVFEATFASTVVFIAIGALHLVLSGWMGDGTESSDYDIDPYDSAVYMSETGYEIDGNVNDSTEGVELEDRRERGGGHNPRRVVRKTK